MHTIHTEQREKAEEIFHLLEYESKLLITFVSSPQWGKTGVAVHLMYMMDLPPQNIFLISGMSDKQWKAQTKERVLPCFKNQVFHRNDLVKMSALLKDKQNVLIIIDECHFGSENNQTLNRCLFASNILDINNMQKNNIKIVCISATPGNVLLDAKRWGTYHETVIAHNTNPLYTGFDTLLREQRIMSCPNLKKVEEVEALFDFIENRFKTPRYHIIRSSTRMLLDSKILELIGNKRYTFMMYNSLQNEKLSIDALLNTKPSNHHFIFIKGYWRAAKTLNDTHIGICLDQSKDYTCTVQGLGGRLLGYNRQSGDSAPVLFGNIDAIEEYISILENNVDYSQCKRYRSLNLVISNFNVKFQKPSTVHPDEILNLNDHTDHMHAVHAMHTNPPKNLGRLKPDIIIKTVTQLTDYTNAEFIKQFNLDILTLPEKASQLNEMLKAKRYSINVSYKKHPAKSVSNLVNFYTHPEWASCEYHVIRRDDDNIRVIRRSLKDLQGLKTGDTIAAHNSEGYMIMYQW